MKYLDLEYHEKVCKIDDEELNLIWDNMYQAYADEFEMISHRFPKQFCVEYRKKHFHDNVIIDMHFTTKTRKGKVVIDLEMQLSDYRNKSIIHLLTFRELKQIKSTMSFNIGVGVCDWIISEFLQTDSGNLSLEVLLYDDSILFIEYEKLKYRKIRCSHKKDVSKTIK